MNIAASRRWVGAFVLLWPSVAFAYFGAGIVLLPVIILAILLVFLLACWVLIPAFAKAWAAPASRPVRIAARLAVALVSLWAAAWLWKGWTADHRPVQRDPRDAPLSALRVLRPDELGAWLLSPIPAPDTCVLRVHPPGAKPDEFFAITSYGRGTLSKPAEEAPDQWTRDSVVLVGLVGNTVGATYYNGLSRVSFRVRQWQSPELWPTRKLRVAWARQRADDRRMSGLAPAPADSEPPSGSDQPLGHRLSLVTDDEIACAATVPHCRRFRAHLVADNSPVELEERCSDVNTPSSFSLAGPGYRRWH
jgi:hypothetical protein